ncbi:hypothetical protein [Histidinibacterium aquaticum]|nr:hypothetical protein [Histidinibacterium aquaticum]
MRALLACLALAACDESMLMTTGPVTVGEETAGAAAPPPPPPPFQPRQPEVGDNSDPCGAGSYLGLIGRDASTVGIGESEQLRFLRPGMEAGEVAVPSRITVVVEPSGMISRVYCG